MWPCQVTHCISEWHHGIQLRTLKRSDYGCLGTSACPFTFQQVWRCWTRRSLQNEPLLYGGQGSPSHRLQAKSSPQSQSGSLLINKVLLAFSHAHWLVFCLRLLEPQRRIEPVDGGPQPTKLKISTIWPFQRKSVQPCPEALSNPLPLRTRTCDISGLPTPAPPPQTPGTTKSRDGFLTSISELSYFFSDQKFYLH